MKNTRIDPVKARESRDNLEYMDEVRKILKGKGIKEEKVKKIGELSKSTSHGRITF